MKQTQFTHSAIMQLNKTSSMQNNNNNKNNVATEQDNYLAN
jgi:hypothetical protein